MSAILERRRPFPKGRLERKYRNEMGVTGITEIAGRKDYSDYRGEIFGTKDSHPNRGSNLCT